MWIPSYKKALTSALSSILVLMLSAFSFVQIAAAGIDSVDPASYNANATGQTMTVIISSESFLSPGDFISVDLGDVNINSYTLVSSSSPDFSSEQPYDIATCGVDPGNFIGVDLHGGGSLTLYFCSDSAGFFGVGETLEFDFDVDIGATGGTYDVTYSDSQGATGPDSSYTIIGAGDRYVATDGADTGDCLTDTSPCFTIGYAITQANEDETIYIDTGIYTEALTISKAVHLSGWTDGGLGRTGSKNTVFLNNLNSYTIPGAATVTGVTISDLSVENDLSTTTVADQTAGGIADGITFDTVKLNYDSGGLYDDCITNTFGSSILKLIIQNSQIYDCGETVDAELFNDANDTDFGTFILDNNTFETPGLNSNIDASLSGLDPTYTPQITSGTSALTFTNNTITSGAEVYEDFLVVDKSGPDVTITDNTFEADSTLSRRLLNIGGNIGSLIITGNTFNNLESSNGIISNCDPDTPTTCYTVDTLTFQDNAFSYTLNNGLLDLIKIVGITTINTISGNTAANLGLELEFDNSASFTISDNTFNDITLSPTGGTVGASSVTLDSNQINQSSSTETTALDIAANTVTVQNNLITTGLGTNGDPVVEVTDGAHSYFNNDIVVNQPIDVFNIVSAGFLQTFRNNNIHVQDDGASAPTAIFCGPGNLDVSTTIENNNIYFDGATTSGVAVAGSDCALDGADNLTSDPSYSEVDSGTYTGNDTAARSFTDNTKSFTVDALAGSYLELNADSLVYYFYILSNTADTIFVQNESDLSGLTFDNSNYSITDFEKEITSDLVDSGNLADAPAVAIDDTVRPQGDEIDMGAYETAGPPNDPPSVDISTIDDLAPVAATSTSLQPVIAWNYSDTDGDPQSTYRVVVCSALDKGSCDAASVEYDSGVLAGADATSQVTPDLDPATTYYVEVTVSDGTDSTTTAPEEFTTGQPGVTLDPIGGLTVTEGASVQFTVVLDNLPTDSVTLDVITDGEGTVDVDPVSIDVADWATPVTVTYTITDDAVDEGNTYASTITIEVTGGGTDYTGLANPVATVTYTVTDNDTTATSGSGGSFQLLNSNNQLTDPLEGDNVDPVEDPTNEQLDENTPETDPANEDETIVIPDEDTGDDEEPDNTDQTGDNFDELLGSGEDTGDSELQPGSLDTQAPETDEDAELTEDENDLPPSTSFEDGRFEALVQGYFGSDPSQRGLDDDAFEDLGDGTFRLRDDDGDGLDNRFEQFLGTDPNNPDTDGDGRTDGNEFINLNTDPTDGSDDFSRYMNPNFKRESITPNATWTVAAPEGSNVTVYYVNEKGERFRLTETESDRNGIALVNVRDLPVGQKIRLITEISTPDGRSYQFTSEEVEVLLSRLTEGADIIEIINGQRTRRILTDNKEFVYEIDFSDPQLVSFTNNKVAKVHFSSLVFSAMILSDSNRDRIVTQIPESILSEPGIHHATLVAYDPETGEYDEPVAIGFMASPETVAVAADCVAPRVIVTLLILLLILLIASLILNVGLYASLKRHILEHHEDNSMDEATVNKPSDSNNLQTGYTPQSEQTNQSLSDNDFSSLE